MTDSGWCVSCRCGWHKAVDAFDVTPPEMECTQPKCQCHQGFWDSVTYESMDELEKRWLWGDK